MDPLSQIIGLLRPRAIGWRVIEAHDLWTIQFDPSRVVVFGQIIEGTCRIERSDGISFEAASGDFILMALPPPWIMTTAAGADPIDFKTLLLTPDALKSKAEGRTVTRFISGNFTYREENGDLLSSVMPPVVHLRGKETAASRLSGFLNAVGEEALAERPGRNLILDRLLEVILVEALRSDSAIALTGGRGILTGLADPKIGQAIQIMHRDSKRSWTVAELARNIGMSRSAFASYFARTVGVTPIEYLANLRMSLAKDALISSDLPMIEIAEIAGYQSVSAFSTAFKKLIGCPPSLYLRTRGIVEAG